MTGPGTNQRGSVIFIVMIAVLVLAALTMFMSRVTRQESGITSSAQTSDQISRLLAYTATLTGAIQQMVINGGNPALLPTADATWGLSTLAPGEGGFDAAPHNYKLFHPYGGGLRYMTQTGTGAALDDLVNAANDFKISKGSIVKGVGPTNTVGDILFTAAVSSQAVCQKINNIVRGTALTAAPPTITNAAYTALFTNGADTTLDDDSGTCAACINIPASCVQNVAGTAWGYYQSLLPQ